MISLVTNIDSLIAQQNLSVNSKFQSNTIQQLTSGYRINSSADDAAGLAVANGYRNQIAELNQGVLNANQGVSQLQILDGGLSNIAQMLDRMKTLATESASDTFTGDRTTLNNEYSQLVDEITRQAANVGLNSGGNFNTSLGVYIGGANISTQSDSSSVSIDLSGASTAVDAASLGLTGTDVLGGTVGGVGFSTNSVRLDNPATSFLQNGTQTYTFNYADSSGNTQSRSVVVSGGSGGVTGDEVISQLNSGLTGTGILASINSTDGTVQFTSSAAFTAGVGGETGGTGTVTGAATLVNSTGQYNKTQSFTNFVDNGTGGAAPIETFTLSDSGHSATITLSAGVAGTLNDAVTFINQQLRAASISDVTALATGDNSTGISFQGAANFSIVESAYTAASGTNTGSLFAGVGAKNPTAATGGGTAGTDAQAAITALNNAVSALGLVQGVVGAGENKLNYAINLAQSQITSFSSAQSQIRDANVAAEAADLTKAQVLQQASIAAMAQANAEPQAVLSLLKG